jgi:hypothetical protein
MRHKNRDRTTGEFFGMGPNATPCAIRWTIAVFVCALVAAPAAAQDARSGAAYANASPPSNPTDEATPDTQCEIPLNPDEAAAFGNALTFDSMNLSDSIPAKSLRLPDLNGPGKFDVSHIDKPDGSRTMVLKQPLAASEWDAKLGADVTLATTPSLSSRPNQPLPLATASQDYGAAWASVGVPNIASLDARVDPTNDQGKLGTTFKQAIPVGNTFSVTLQNTYSVTKTFSSSTTTAFDVPLMAAPVAGPPASQVWGTEKVIKFNLLTTGTTFGAGVTTASNDPVTHNTFSADQKLYGPLHVTTAVTDFGQPTAGKSLTAAFKLNW